MRPNAPIVLTVSNVAFQAEVGPTSQASVAHGGIKTLACEVKVCLQWVNHTLGSNPSEEKSVGRQTLEHLQS